MATTPDFSRKAAPPAPAASRVVKLPGNVPLVPGQIYVSDYTRQQLEPFGWKEGDPIPGDFAARVQAVQDQFASDKAAELARLQASNPTAVAPTEVKDICDMPPEYQAQIRDLLTAAKLYEQEDARRAAAVPSDKLAPSVQQALQQIREAAAPDVEIIDDTQTPVEPKPASAAPAQHDAPTQHDAPAEDGRAGGLPHLASCPRCNWDLNVAFTAEPTEADKEGFIAALLGGTRFRRSFELLGGKLVVTYRSLTSREGRLILTQLAQDVRAGELLSDTEYYMKLMDYRLCCGFESIVDEVGRVIATMPEIFEIPYEPPEESPQQTVLVQTLKFFTEETIPQEPTQRIVGVHHRQFQRLVEALEAMTDEPSFWNGTEQQP